MSKVQAHVEEITPDHPMFQTTAPDGSVVTALTLRQHLDLQGGQWKVKHDYTDVDGKKMKVECDLRPFKDRDPDTTYLVVGVMEQFTYEEAKRHNLRG